MVDAYQRDLEVVLAQDCIDSYDQEHHDISWRYMDGRLGRGMSNEEIRSLVDRAAPSGGAAHGGWSRWAQHVEPGSIERRR